MPDLYSCFGELEGQVADPLPSNVRTIQNMVACLYHTELVGVSCLLTLTWCKNIIGQSLFVNVDGCFYQCSCKADMRPWKKKGCKSFWVGSRKIDMFWDLSSAKYESAPEPVEGFFVALVSAQEMILLLGDMADEAYRKTQANTRPFVTRLISRREYIYGKGLYSTNAQFGESGRTHEIIIECEIGGLGEPRLCVRVDRQLVVQIKRLMWKFRGNQTIVVDDLPVELFWDVHNWLFNSSDGHAVFMFQTCLAPDFSWSDVTSSTSIKKWQPATNCKGKEWQAHGFSLLLYVWNSE